MKTYLPLVRLFLESLDTFADGPVRRRHEQNDHHRRQQSLGEYLHREASHKDGARGGGDRGVS